MSDFCATVFGSQFDFRLPFEHLTKTEMLKSLKVHGLCELAQQSRSCIHTSMRVVAKSHCGHCPACIERRQAFTVAGVREWNIYKSDIFSAPPIEGSDAAYFRLYQDEAISWLEGSPASLSRMRVHLTGTNVSTKQGQDIHRLWGRHSREIADTFVHPRVAALAASVRQRQSRVLSDQGVQL